MEECRHPNGGYTQGLRVPRAAALPGPRRVRVTFASVSVAVVSSRLTPRVTNRLHSINSSVFRDSDLTTVFGKSQVAPTTPTTPGKQHSRDHAARGHNSRTHQNRNARRFRIARPVARECSLRLRSAFGSAARPRIVICATA